MKNMIILSETAKQKTLQLTPPSLQLHPTNTQPSTTNNKQKYWGNSIIHPVILNQNQHSNRNHPNLTQPQISPSILSQQNKTNHRKPTNSPSPIQKHRNQSSSLNVGL
jgi:hypothetical protein